MSKVPVERKASEQNYAVAARNRDFFQKQGVYVMNVIGSPGCGKTSVLEHTARNFAPGAGRMAAVIGDLKTTLDAERLAACGIQARGIETGGGCHLNAAQVAAAVRDLDLSAADYLFIENVGNLVCPSAFDLGEDIKVAMLSVPEGDEKVRKYPALFVRADVVFINKLDLIGPCPFDLGRVRDDLRKARPRVRVFETSAAQGRGFEPWFEFLSNVAARAADGAGRAPARPTGHS
jgi:hydrogenase nickel incorporation protein HypB